MTETQFSKQAVETIVRKLFNPGATAYYIAEAWADDLPEVDLDRQQFAENLIYDLDFDEYVGSLRGLQDSDVLHLLHELEDETTPNLPVPRWQDFLEFYVRPGDCSAVKDALDLGKFGISANRIKNIIMPARKTGHRRAASTMRPPPTLERSPTPARLPIASIDESTRKPRPLTRHHGDPEVTGRTETLGSAAPGLRTAVQPENGFYHRTTVDVNGHREHTEYEHDEGRDGDNDLQHQTTGLSSERCHMKKRKLGLCHHSRKSKEDKGTSRRNRNNHSTAQASSMESPHESSTLVDPTLDLSIASLSDHISKGLDNSTTEGRGNNDAEGKAESADKCIPKQELSSNHISDGSVNSNPSSDFSTDSSSGSCNGHSVLNFAEDELLSMETNPDYATAGLVPAKQTADVDMLGSSGLSRSSTDESCMKTRAAARREAASANQSMDLLSMQSPHLYNGIDSTSPSTVKTFYSALEMPVSRALSNNSTPGPINGANEPDEEMASAATSSFPNVKSAGISALGNSNSKETRRSSRRSSRLGTMARSDPVPVGNGDRGSSPTVIIKRLPATVLAEYKTPPASTRRNTRTSRSAQKVVSADARETPNEESSDDQDREIRDGHNNDRDQSDSSEHYSSDSSLSDLSRSPTPLEWQAQSSKDEEPESTTQRQLRKRKQTSKNEPDLIEGHDSKPKATPEKRKRTSTTSEHFASPKQARKDIKRRRVPAGQSAVTFPPTTAERFGIVQEGLWEDPFALLIAVVFLNKTNGKVAMPVYQQVMARYPTPADLAAADPAELVEMVRRLGLQMQRSKKLIGIARTWLERAPRLAVRFRTLHYPAKGDGRQWTPSHVVREDADDCAGALEIGHLPGCGDYARDSWRIFCRDVLRGRATDYNGRDAVDEGFEPEWKRVLPLDKELRAFLRWMWLREGFVWDELTGSKQVADEETLEKARRGETEWTVRETRTVEETVLRGNRPLI